MIQNKNALDLLKELPDYSTSLIFSDPPYNLGSEIKVNTDGHMVYTKTSDFMNKWNGLTAQDWETFFNESYRIQKHGGFNIMFGMDRQLPLITYYAIKAGYKVNQSLYWYFICNFPKATDLSKNIDKNLGVKPIGSEKPNFGLAKKYEGYKYSVAPLKQTCETILVFQKPYKSGSCLHDTLAMENGNKTVTCGALDIENNRVVIDISKETDKRIGTDIANKGVKGNPFESGTSNYANPTFKDGRFPAQTFIDSGTAEILDLQSSKMGMHLSGNKKAVPARDYNASSYKFGTFEHNPNYYNDTKESASKCSRILHKCDYEETDFDLFHYNPKVNKSERNTGINQNTHPTLKPINLITKILKLFKLPDGVDQTLLLPFAGTGSEYIGALKAGFTHEQITASELNPEYIIIAEARIKHWEPKLVKITTPNECLFII